MSVVVHRHVRPDSPSTYGITFAFWREMHFPQAGAATACYTVVAETEPDPQPRQAVKEDTEP